MSGTDRHTDIVVVVLVVPTGSRSVPMSAERISGSMTPMPPNAGSASSDQFWCPDRLPPQRRANLLAVIGVLSYDGRADFRQAARETWFGQWRSRSSISEFASVESWFVLRGYGARQDTLAEAQRERDMIFVGAAANATWAPPLQSIWLWYKCAVSAWPDARFLGKADDDVWAQTHDVARSLAMSSVALQQTGIPLSNIFWGVMESATWNESACLPGPWPSYRWVPCSTQQLQGVHGPFSFPKGPLYFIGRSLVERFVSDSGVRLAAAATIATRIPFRERGCAKCSKKP